MGDLVAQFDDQFNWDDLFDDPNLFDIQVADPSLVPNDFSNLSPDSLNFSVDDMEQLLMNDDEEDYDRAPLQDLSNGFMSDILLDSPVGCDGSPGEVVDDVSDVNKNSSPSGEEKEDEEKDPAAVLIENNESTDADAGDPLSKKRKRQLRNRDAAVRSRERKKVYVKDLEMKSRYYEGECKRLGMLLQCFLAENQALRLSLQNSKAFDASMTKQESAVLLLESLLLGSLLWFLGVMCLLILPSQLHPSRGGAVQLEIVESERQESPTPKKVASKTCDCLVLQSFLVGKRCKASRSRMKPSFRTPLKFWHDRQEILTSFVSICSFYFPFSFF